MKQEEKKVQKDKIKELYTRNNLIRTEILKLKLEKKENSRLVRTIKISLLESDPE